MTEQRDFYVTMIRDSKVAYLLGPFESHAAALNMVQAARADAESIDPFCHFDLFGTCHKRFNVANPAGKLNARLGVVPRCPIPLPILSLQAMRDIVDTYEEAFLAVCAGVGTDEWTWHRAVSAAAGEIGRRNDDTSRDAALAGNTEIRAAWDAYIAKLHAYYLLRDGPSGVFARVVK